MFCCCFSWLHQHKNSHDRHASPHQNLASLPGQERGSQVPRLCNVSLTSKRNRGPFTLFISAPSLCYRPVSLHMGTKNLKLSPCTSTVKIHLPGPPVTKICVLKIVTPKEMILGGRGSGRWLDHDGEVIMSGVVAIKEFPGSCLESSTMQLHKKKAPFIKEKVHAHNAEPSSTLIVGLTTPRISEK